MFGYDEGGGGGIEVEKLDLKGRMGVLLTEVRKMTTKFIECENCEGSGFVEEECPECEQMIEVKCPDCEGLGKVEEVEEEEVRKMKINVAYSRTVNLGNFNSMRAEAGLEVESSLVLREADFDWAWKEVKSQVEKQIKNGEKV